MNRGWHRMKILVTSSLQLSDDDINELSTIQTLDMGESDVIVQDDRQPLSPELLESDVVVGTGFLRRTDLRHFSNLRFVQFTSAGLDGLPLRELKDRGIPYASASGVYTQPMTEWALLQILRFYKRSALFDEQQSDRSWEKHRDLLELSGKTAVIIGYGSVGESIGNVLASLGARILAVSRTRKEVPTNGSYVPLEEMTNVLGEADIVVLSIALVPETHHLIDATALVSMKAGSVLLNLARGELIDTDALVEAVQRKHFRGVALDVFEEEPLPSSSPLWTLPNVIITPHVSFISDGTRGRMFKLALANIRKVLD